MRDPNKSNEDDGILLSVLFNTKLNQTELHGIDARNMQHIFTSIVPGFTGFTFHGEFFNH